ncbi:MAG: hypothetical protein WB952_11850 [Terriglobales bacterium]
MRITKLALVLVLFVAAATMTAQAQQDVQVFVPGTASGYFGNPQDQAVPFVSALTVSGPGTITVTYISGTVTDCCGINTGPNGVEFNARGQQWPLQEAHGRSGGIINNEDALIGVFVPQSRVLCKGFTAIDGTKNATRVGIMPNKLFFIGEGKTFDVTEAGTLFLGINDIVVGDNGGGFTVEVTGP